MTGKPKYKPYSAKINPLPTTASVRLVAYAMTSGEIEPDEYFDYHNLHGMTGLGNRTIERLLPEFARLGWLWPERQECEGHYYSLDAAQLTLSEAWGHFQVHELGRKRSLTTIQNYEDYFKCYVLPKWGDTFIDKIETVAVEEWLDNLKRAPETRWNRPPTDVEPKHLAPATRAKIRNQMSCVFSHLIRHKLYRQLNPITEVRTSSIAERETEPLDLDEILAILNGIGPDPVRVMVAVAAASALRRSEIRGLKWNDLDFDRLWFNLRRGLVRKLETNMKSRASRKPVPMLPELAKLLQNWREKSPYGQDDDWVFASPYTDGKFPYWPDSALTDHIRPAAVAAGITKHLGWHTFRHSVGTLLDEAGASLKTVQEILHHANSRITADVYQHGNNKLKRTALGGLSGIFVIKKAS